MTHYEIGDARRLSASFRNALGFVPTDVVIATDVITVTAHGLSDADPVRFTNTGNLPAPLEPDTDYFVRDKTADTLKVAAASGGTAIDITSVGTYCRHRHLSDHSHVQNQGAGRNGDDLRQRDRCRERQGLDRRLPCRLHDHASRAALLGVQGCWRAGTARGSELRRAAEQHLMRLTLLLLAVLIAGEAHGTGAWPWFKVSRLDP